MKLLHMLAAGAAALLLTACSDEAKLASNLQGTWSGAPERFTVNEAATATMTPVYSFALGQDDKTGGDLTVSAMISAIIPINSPIDAVVIPFQCQVSAIATVQGTWRATDDDEVALNLNLNTLSVNVNPDNLTTADDALTDQTMKIWEQNRTAFAKQVQAAIQTALEVRFMGMRELDDVKIKNDVLEHKVAGVHYFLHRDATPVL